MNRLALEGFRRIGRFSFDDSSFNQTVEVLEARAWFFAVYAWVSFNSGGTVMRIGKSEGKLGGRIGQYKTSLDHRMSGRIGPNEHFKKDTQQWELELWKSLTIPFDFGLIFAKQVGSVDEAREARRQALEMEERRLIFLYNPVLCGDSPAGRAQKREWVAKHGQSTPVGKRER